MYIECFINNAKPYLRLVKSSRITNKEGKKIPKKQELNDVVRDLIGISNSFYLPYGIDDRDTDRTIDKWKKEIERILDI